MSPSARQPADPDRHVKDIDLSTQSFVLAPEKHTFVASEQARLKLLSKRFLKPLVRESELCQFALD
jgi:hypothetical protein